MRRFVGPVACTVLGLNLWAVLLLVPALHTGSPARNGALAAGLLALPLVVLAVGVVLLVRAHARTGPVLLAGFPISLLVLPVADPVLVGPGSHGGATLALTLASLLAYSGVVAWLLARADEPTLSIRSTRLRHPEGDVRAAERRRDRWLVLGLAALVPIAIAVLPFVRPGAREDIERAYSSAPEAAAATIVALATALAVGVLLVYFAPMLRRAQVFPADRASPRTRIGWTVALTVLGAAAAIALGTRG